MVKLLEKWFYQELRPLMAICSLNPPGNLAIVSCSYGDLANVPVSFGMSWKKAGGKTSAGDGSIRLEFGHPHQSRKGAREELKEKTITVLVNDTIDHFRIRPDIKPCFFKLSKMSFLVPEADMKSSFEE
jgi:hypothetical protein